jgi:hypothetical protein
MKGLLRLLVCWVEWLTRCNPGRVGVRVRSRPGHYKVVNTNDGLCRMRLNTVVPCVYASRQGKQNITHRGTVACSGRHTSCKHPTGWRHRVKIYMIWYDMIWYMIWYDMIRYDTCYRLSHIIRDNIIIKPYECGFWESRNTRVMVFGPGQIPSRACFCFLRNHTSVVLY